MSGRSSTAIGKVRVSKGWNKASRQSGLDCGTKRVEDSGWWEEDGPWGVIPRALRDCAKETETLLARSSSCADGESLELELLFGRGGPL